jgi:hypothetical protein
LRSISKVTDGRPEQDPNEPPAKHTSRFAFHVIFWRNEGDRMRYFAQVIIAFSDLQKGRNVFDVWESTLVLDADGPGQALKQAIPNSRRVFDDPKNWRALGYFSESCFYGVRSVFDEEDLPGDLPRGTFPDQSAAPSASRCDCCY